MTLSTASDPALYDAVSKDWWDGSVRWVRTLANLVPAMLHLLSSGDDERPRLPRLRCAFIIGDVLTHDDVAALYPDCGPANDNRQSLRVLQRQPPLAPPSPRHSSASGRGRSTA